MHTIRSVPRLDHVTARRAVVDYQFVYAQGVLSQFHAELTVAFREAESRRLRQSIRADFDARTIANDLARLLNCNPAELLAAAQLQLAGEDRIAIVLRLLRDFAERLRRDRKGVA